MTAPPQSPAGVPLAHAGAGRALGRAEGRQSRRGGGVYEVLKDGAAPPHVQSGRTSLETLSMDPFKVRVCRTGHRVYVFSVLV